MAKRNVHLGNSFRVFDSLLQHPFIRLSHKFFIAAGKPADLPTSGGGLKPRVAFLE